WPASNGQAIIGKELNPAEYGNLRSWLDASDANFLSTSASSLTPPSSGDAIQKWNDRSGNGHYATVLTGGPVWQNNAFNSKPGVVFTADVLQLENGASAFDNWDKLHVIAAFYQHPGRGHFSVLFGKSTYSGWLDNNKDTGWSVVAHRQDGTYNLWGPQVITDTNGDGTADANYYMSGNLSKLLQGDDGGAPGLFTMSFNGATLKASLNGGASSGSASLSGVIQPRPSLPFTIGGDGTGGRTLDLKIGEFLIFNSKLSDADEDIIEGYLAHKWNLTSVLPSGHAYKSTNPAASGWSVGRASTGTDAVGLDLAGAGGEFTANGAINDNQWHHLATTFGGGNKKIYVDGTQVGTASQTGSVTDSGAALVLGELASFGYGAVNSAKISDVRFYRGVLSADEVSALYNDGTGDVGEPKFAITSPAAISATVGKSISYQTTVDTAYGMTGYNAAITYSLLNAPSWLSVGSSSGIVTGTPPAAGTYTFQVKGINTLGSNIKDVTITATSLSNWNYSLSFTTDYNGGSPLKDWNMLVRFSEDSSTGTGTAGFRYSQAASNGGDLRFISKSGEELKYEIANWNTAGESQVWVRVPSLASDANVTAYWGNANAGMP
ncbi:MAG: DUF2341 domain-containing protein, partial [Opitutae bacterium]